MTTWQLQARDRVSWTLRCSLAPYVPIETPEKNSLLISRGTTSNVMLGSRGGRILPLSVVSVKPWKVKGSGPGRLSGTSQSFQTTLGLVGREEAS